MDSSKKINSLRFIRILFKRILVFSLLAALSLLLLIQFKYINFFPIKRVSIYGINHVDPLEAKRIVLPLVKRGFFNIDVETIREHLLPLSWVENIGVRRIWPDTVLVTLIEKNPIALWNNDSLLSDNGELFTTTINFEGKETLPKFFGPLGSHMIMLEYFAEMNRLLKPLRVKIVTLKLSSYLTWQLQLNNGINLQLGHKDILTRVARFVKVYSKIVGNREKAIDYFDLRYQNGMAVKWKS